MDLEAEEYQLYYDKYGENYANTRINKGLLFNEYIERPALIKLFQEDVINNKKILDIGCGPGMYTKYFAQQGAQVDAIDISSKMLSIAKHHCKSNLSFADYKNISFYNVSFDNYIKNNVTYDLILASFMLGYFKDIDLFFNKARKILKPNGTIISTMLHPVKISIKNEYSNNVIINYFDENIYQSDLNSISDKLNLHKWRISDISEASYKSGLIIERIIEPSPILELPKEYEEKAKIYKNIPSIMILKMRVNTHL